MKLSYQYDMLERGICLTLCQKMISDFDNERLNDLYQEKIVKYEKVSFLIFEILIASRSLYNMASVYSQYFLRSSISSLCQTNIMQILWHIGRLTIEWLMLVSILNLRRIIISRRIRKSSLVWPVTRG